MLQGLPCRGPWTGQLPPAIHGAAAGRVLKNNNVAWHDHLPSLMFCGGAVTAPYVMDARNKRGHGACAAARVLPREALEWVNRASG